MANKKQNKIEIDQILLNNREIFLFESVNEISASLIVKQLFVLDKLNNNPIAFYLNTPGGSCTAGLAIINAMRMIKSPVITIINNEVCSMGSHISVAGDYRKMTWNGLWMAHDARGGTDGDYFGKVEYRVEALKKLYNALEQNYVMYTKLTVQDLELAKNGELWLTADECLKKGIIDEIINP